jgi:hypothetical protein
VPTYPDGVLLQDQRSISRLLKDDTVGSRVIRINGCFVPALSLILTKTVFMQRAA